MMNTYIHHTIFTHFTEINKKHYPHQSEHNIITTPTEVDKYTQSTSCPFTLLQQHKYTTVITLWQYPLCGLPVKLSQLLS